MQSLRYYPALGLMVGVPLMLLYWALLHPFVNSWRRLGAVRSLMLICAILVLAGAALFTLRQQVLAIEFGHRPALMLAGAACLLTAGWLRQRLHRHFSWRLLLGLPEIAGQQSPQRLITEGLHAHVRHPRYLQIALALLGWALVANYLAGYVAFGLWLPGMWAIAVLEEKELRDRFGAAYEAYCRRVPRFLPRWRQG